MPTIVSIVACAALLAVAGWWIGRQFANDVLSAGASQLTIAMPDVGAFGRRTGRNIVAAAREIAPFCLVTVVDDDSISHESASVRVERIVRNGKTIGATFHPKSVHPGSCAIQHITLTDPPGREDWKRVAAVALANGGVATLNTLPADRSESRYLNAWRAMHRAFQEDVPEALWFDAYGLLRNCVDAWPNDDEGKSVALANLARVCLAMPKTPITRVPRLLEGLDAARAALRCTYDAPASGRIVGLRALLVDLRREIERETNVVTSNPSHGSANPSDFRADTARSTVPYPHGGDTTGHGAPRIRP